MTRPAYTLTRTRAADAWARLQDSAGTTWGTWIVTRTVGLLLLTGNLPYGRAFARVNGDVHLYAGWSDAIFHGAAPYSGFELQYPPGVVPFFLLPHWSTNSYVVEFLILAVVADLACLKLLRHRARHPMGAMLWLVMVPLLGPVAWGRLDIFVALALVVALVAFESGRYGLAGAAVAYAGLLKLWPLALLVLLLPCVDRPFRRKFLFGGGATIAALVVPLLVVATPRELLWPLQFELHRGVEIESLPAVPLHVAQVFGSSWTLDHKYGSLDLRMPADRAVELVSTVALLMCWLAVAMRQMRDARYRLTPAATTLAIAALTVCFSKVLSPQYLLWIGSAAAVYIDRARDPARLALWVCVAAFTTQMVFPFLFLPLQTGADVGALVAILHAAAILGLAIVIVSEVRARGRRELPLMSAQQAIPA